MTLDALRAYLYSIGFLASLFFGARFFVQWLQSEKKKQSLVTRTFWILSLGGNASMALHGLLQLQLPILLLQTINGVIAWRNLNLMGTQACSTKRTVALLCSFVALALALFGLQAYYLGDFEWMRAPTMPWSTAKGSVTPLWMHLLGLGGMVLFASRFWIQWWQAETHQKSVLGRAFWIMSLVGGSLSLVYFIFLQDAVNVLSYGLGLLPYMRNLMLMKKKAPERPQSESLFVFAGEQSGDLLGGALLEDLKKSHPSLKTYGVGGLNMQKAGMQPIMPMAAFHVMGFLDVLLALPRLFKNYRHLKKTILQDNPKAVLLIDYPDFNLFLARALRKGGYKGKLIHYVCPSIWAWRKGRSATLVSHYDHLLTILPFEKELFAKTPLSVSYVGHPLVKTIQEHRYNTSWRTSKGIQENSPLLALFPGSRGSEITMNLPLQLETAKLFLRDYPDGQIALSMARKDLEPKIHAAAAKSGLNPHFVPCEERYELMQTATAALATSGTITLELGLHATPTVVTYRMPLFNAFLGRFIFRIILPYYCLVNILAKKEIFPEFFDAFIEPKSVYISLQRVLENAKEIKNECSFVKQTLQGTLSQSSSQTVALEMQLS